MTQNAPSVIGIDLGGTAIKLGLFNSSGTTLNSKTVDTPQPATPNQVISAIKQAIAELDPNQTAKAIGLGTPGPVDATKKISLVAINLVEWYNVPLANMIQSITQLPVILENDANCAGIGESWIGAGRDYSHLIMLTLGTGVGGAIILNRQLFTGHLGIAGELGLMSINPDGPPCNSGNSGSLESYLSISAIRRQTGLEPPQLYNLAKNGDSQALTFWQNYGRILGIGLTNLAYILTPQAIIIGGGVAASADFFLPSAITQLKQRLLFEQQINLQVLSAKLGNQAGMIGAAKLAFSLLPD